MKSKYKAMVLSCMDPRFQLPVFKFIKKNNLVNKHSSFTLNINILLEYNLPL